MSTAAATASQQRSWYREAPAPIELASVVACLWEQRTDELHIQRIVPDGCVDVIWVAGRGLHVAGADRSARDAPLAAGTRITGARLRPGAAGAVLGVPASEVCGTDVDAAHLWGADAARLSESLAAADPAARPALLTEALISRRPTRDELVTAAAALLSNAPARVSDIAATLGISERQLHRRTVAAVGYGPKVLARVARLRRLIAAHETSLARRALDAGYASQAHMNDEVRRLTGLTPVRFLQDARLTAA